MRVKAEKVVDPESIAWIEQHADGGSDEGYFESAWLRALNEAALDLERRRRREAAGQAGPAGAAAGDGPAGGGGPAQAGRPGQPSVRRR